MVTEGQWFQTFFLFPNRVIITVIFISQSSLIFLSLNYSPLGNDLETVAWLWYLYQVILAPLPHPFSFN